MEGQLLHTTLDIILDSQYPESTRLQAGKALALLLNKYQGADFSTLAQALLDRFTLSPASAAAYLFVVKALLCRGHQVQDLLKALLTSLVLAI